MKIVEEDVISPLERARSGARVEISRVPRDRGVGGAGPRIPRGGEHGKGGRDEEKGKTLIVQFLPFHAIILYP